MTPYIAVLKDSLREAMASRVLWVALIGIAIVLVALAPFALRTDTATELRRRELVDAEQIVRSMVEAADAPETPAGHLWSLLDDEGQREFRDLLKTDDADRRRGPRRGPQRRIVRVFNELLKRDDFFSAEVFQELLDRDEQLVAQGFGPDLSEDERAAGNLRLLAAAFPRAIRLKDSTEVTLTYAGREVAGPLPLAPSELEPITEQVLVFVVSGFLGFLGVFSSLLVTAAIIPRTFEPGEIALLLSKPVNRSFLLLTKFAGGCAFTLVCGSVLVVGVWLLLGVRLGIWEHKLLLCIPVYVFLFSVYYSVSAVTGLIWRNAVVSLVLVVVFWMVLSIVGVVKTVIDENVFQPSAVTEIIPAQGRLFAVSGSRQVLLYNATTREWEEKFKRDDRGMSAMLQRFVFAATRFRPVHDPANQRLLAVEQSASRFGGVGRGRVVIGYEADDWDREPQGDAPDVLAGLFLDPGGRVILLGRDGVYEFVGQTDTERKTREFFDNLLGGLVSTTNRNAYRKISGSDVPRWETDFTAAMDKETGALFVYSGGTVHRLDLTDDDTYSLAESRDLETDEHAVLSAGGGKVTIALGDGSIRLLNSATLADVLTDQLPDGVLPRVSMTAPDGSVSAVLTHSGELRLYEPQLDRRADWSPPEDGSVSGIGFDAEGALFVADGRQTVRVYELGQNTPAREYSVDGDWVTRLYDWLINPLYTLLPKPAEVDNFVFYLLTGRRSQSIVRNISTGRENLEEDRVTFDLWTPLWSNIAFVAVMLLYGCWYVTRKDF